jgi:hypothetical protein
MFAAARAARQAQSNQGRPTTTVVNIDTRAAPELAAP